MAVAVPSLPAPRLRIIIRSSRWRVVIASRRLEQRRDDALLVGPKLTELRGQS